MGRYLIDGKVAGQAPDLHLTIYAVKDKISVLVLAVSIRTNVILTHRAR